MKKSVNALIKNENISFDEFYDILREHDTGFWDGVNDREIIYDYCNEMMMKGIAISHILAVLENDPYDSTDIYKIWLGNSMEIPEPINTKQELADALGLDGTEKVEAEIA